MKRPDRMIVLAALLAVCASAAANPLPSHFSHLPQATVEVQTASGPHRFQVWIAADDASRELGLMRVRDLPADRGMLFLFERPQYVAFWMKDTFVSLDLVFIGPDGAVVNIGEHATPHSLEPIESDGPVSAVLEVVAGTADRLGIAPGNRVRHPAFHSGR